MSIVSSIHQQRWVVPCDFKLSPSIHVSLFLNSSTSHNGHLISPNATGAVVSGGHHQPSAHQRFNSSINSNNINHNAKLSKERDSEASSAAAAMRLLSSNHSNAHPMKGRSRSPAVAAPSTANKASLSNPSLAASLAAASQAPHDHHSTSTAAGQSSLISSFLTGLPASMFTPMIDMTSTQALVTLVSK